jgi:hypothetical protein
MDKSNEFAISPGQIVDGSTNEEKANPYRRRKNATSDAVMRQDPILRAGLAAMIPLCFMGVEVDGE